MNTITTLLRQLRPALLAVVLATVVCGLVYPAAVWAVSRIGSDHAEGSALRDANGCVVGSALEGVDPSPAPGAPDPYFHTRVVGSSDEEDPRAAAMAPGDPAGGAPSNLGPSNPTLADWIATRRQVVAEREHVTPEAVPVDAVTGSGSGLDPHISPEYAAIQVPRVARENRLDEARVRELVDEHTDGRQLGVLGQPRVKVAELNVALGLTAPDCATR